DIAGCAHLFGGEAELHTSLCNKLSAQGFSTRAAIASTPGAAWALTRFSRQNIIEDVESALAQLPVQALRLEPGSAALLKRLGLKTIDQLSAAPRSSFAARAGEHALLRLDQALGRAPEALMPRRPAPQVYVARGFLEPIFTLEAL